MMRALPSPGLSLGDHMIEHALGVLGVPVGIAWPLTCTFGSWRGTRTPNLLFTRQRGTVHRVLLSAVLAAPVGRVVQPVRC
jgi:uncharacterized membrane protein